MTEKLAFVAAAQRDRVPFGDLCDLFGITRKTGYKWWRRFESGGREGLEELSRRPHGNCRAVPKDVVRRVIAMRRKHSRVGPRKLIAWLEQIDPKLELPAASTVGEILKREGLVHPRRRRRAPGVAPGSTRTTHADVPNALWTMDYKGRFRVGNGDECHPLTMLDACSRYGLACRAVEAERFAPTWGAIERVFYEFGLPLAILSDNGPPFGEPSMRGISRLDVRLTKLGIRVEHIEPGKPQQNGRHERFHLTLKNQTVVPPAPNLRAQQRRFNTFLNEYNFERPHEALDQRPPASVYVPSLRKYTGQVPEPEYPRHYETRRICDRRIYWRGAVIYVSKTLENEEVGLCQTADGLWEVYFADLLLGRIHEAHPELGLVRVARSVTDVSGLV